MLAARLGARNAAQSAGFEELALLWQASRGAPGGEAAASGGGASGAGGAGGGLVASAFLPASAVDAQREVLRLRNELDSCKGALAEARSEAARERAGRLRAEAADQAARSTVETLQAELRAVRSQNLRLEERLMDSSARIHDLETRMVEEKLRMAETLNAMNDMVLQPRAPPPAQQQQQQHQQHQQKSPSSASSFSKGLAGTVVEVGGEAGGAEGHTRVWSSNVGVSLPTEWRVLSEPLGVSIASLCFSSDGRELVTGGADGVVQVWSVPLGRKVPGCAGSAGLPVNSIDTKGSLVLASSDRACWLWRAATQSQSESKAPLNLLHKLTGHASTVVTAKLTPDCRHAASGGREIKLWDIATGDCTRTIDAFSKCLALDVNEQGSLLITGHADKGLRLWDLRTAKRVDAVEALHTAPITSVAFSRDGDRVLTCSMDHSLAVLRTTALQRDDQRLRLAHPEFRTNPWFCKACISPGADRDGSLLAACGAKDGGLYVWQLSSGRHAYVQKAHAEAVTCAAWSPLGTQLATCDTAGAVLLWTAARAS
jgi:WD40 repeat protein